MSEQSVAIVTGAGSGIGRAVCKKLASHGYHIVMVGRTRETLESAASEIGESNALVLTADVAEVHQAEAVVNQTIEHFGRVNVLVNNAGTASLTGIDGITPDVMQKVFQINAFGPAYLIRACWPHFQRQQRGCIVNVSSMAVIAPFPGLAVYAASKSALDSLSRSVVAERGESDIEAYSVAPGAVETPMLRGLFTQQDLPTEKTLLPDEVADVIVACVIGRRKSEMGSVISVPSPA